MTSWRAVVVVSALAVFAVAIGVILGSGPLRTALLGQTAQEADSLRGEVADRDAQLLAQQADAQILERYLQELTPVTAESRLDGHSVAIVVAPDAPQAGIDLVVAAIADAGGNVTTTATLGDAWFAAEQGAFRAALASEIVADVGVASDDAAPEAVLQAALVQTLIPALAVAGAPAPAEGETPVDPAIAQQRAHVLEDVLTKAELVAIERAAVDPDNPAPEPTIVVLIVGPGNSDPAQRAADSASVARLALAFIDNELAAVVATGPVSDSDVSSVVDASPAQFSKVSVAADAWGPAGPVVVVLAAQEQLGTGSGLYGDPARQQLVPVP